MAAISAVAVKALRDMTGAGMMDCKRVLADADGDVDKAVELLRERGLAKAGKREGRATSEGVIAISLDAGAGGMVELGCETDFVARTDDFVGLATSLADAVASDAAIDGADALLERSLDGEKVADRVAAAIAKLGENVVVKRVSRLAADGGHVGGYVHAGGKLGVLVGLAAKSAEAEGLAKDLAMHVAAADPSPVAVNREGVDASLIESERKIYRAQAEQDGKPEKIIDRIVDGKVNKFLADIVLLDQPYVKDPDKTIKELLGDTGVTGFARFKLGETGEA